MNRESDLLARILDLEKIEENIFRSTGSHVHALGRVFGGQVAAQSLMAACRTVERDDVHSLHSYFLRPGDPDVPILFQVDRIRDGHSFTTRRVVAIQHGEAIFNLHCSFQKAEDGLDHQDRMPEVPPPEGLPMLQRSDVTDNDWSGYTGWGMDVRVVDAAPDDNPRAGGRPQSRVWLRPLDRLGDDPRLHAAALAYASDLTILRAVLIAHGGPLRFERQFIASLDHCMWFHRRIRADGWLLYDQHSPTASGARGLAMGSIFDANGVLGVSVAQEGLVRVNEKMR